MHKPLFLIALYTLILSSCAKEKGCTDPTATNYNAEAEKDNGSCLFDDQTDYQIPSTYTFEDENGNNTVSYSGQTDRLKMFLEIKDYLATANTSGIALDKQKLLDMFANQNNAFSSANLNASTKQIENKVFSLDVPNFKAYFDSVALHSSSIVAGNNGTAGVIDNGTKSYLFAANGFEYAQLIEKELMGALIYYQIAEVYTRDEKIGEAVNNTSAVDPDNGKYYTDMEHHWDEAFGYFGVPTDFPSNIDELVFVGKYSKKRNDFVPSSTLMNAFIKGRAGISNNNADIRFAQADIIRSEIEQIFASSVIHYFNVSIANITDDVARNHALSEAVGFLKALKYNSDAVISASEIEAILNTLGNNFYSISISDINSAKDQLSSIYSLDAIKDQL